MTEGTGTGDADTTDRIRRSALEQFSEAGYGSVNVDEIARCAGVGVATLYRRWPDKAALANDLFASTLDDMERLAVDAGGATDRQRFLSLWQRLWAYATENPQEFLFVEGHVHAAFISDENVARKRDLATRIAEALADLGIGADPNVATALIIGTTVALLRADERPDPNDVGQRFWAALRPA